MGVCALCSRPFYFALKAKRHMAATSRLKLRQTKDGIVEKLTNVVRDAAGEVLASALEESPPGVSPVSRSRVRSRVQNPGVLFHEGLNSML